MNLHSTHEIEANTNTQSKSNCNSSDYWFFTILTLVISLVLLFVITLLVLTIVNPNIHSMCELVSEPTFIDEENRSCTIYIEFTARYKDSCEEEFGSDIKLFRYSGKESFMLDVLDIYQEAYNQTNTISCLYSVTKNSVYLDELEIVYC